MSNQCFQDSSQGVYQHSLTKIAAALAHAGAMDRAEWEAIELMVLNPNFSLEWLDFAFSFKDPRELEVLLAGLRKVGFSGFP